MASSHKVVAGALIASIIVADTAYAAGVLSEQPDFTGVQLMSGTLTSSSTATVFLDTGVPGSRHYNAMNDEFHFYIQSNAAEHLLGNRVSSNEQRRHSVTHSGPKERPMAYTARETFMQNGQRLFRHYRVETAQLDYAKSRGWEIIGPTL